MSYLSGNALKRRTSNYNAPKGHIGLSRARTHAPARFPIFAHARAHTPSPSPEPHAPRPAPEHRPHALQALRQNAHPNTPPGGCIDLRLSIQGGAVSERTGEGRGLIALLIIYLLKSKILRYALLSTRLLQGYIIAHLMLKPSSNYIIYKAYSVNILA